MLCSLFFTTPTTYQMVSSNYQRECDLTERKKKYGRAKGKWSFDTYYTPQRDPNMPVFGSVYKNYLLSF
jgi:hypothetical protein